MDQDKDSLLGVAFSILEILQISSRDRDDRILSCGVLEEDNTASCSEEKVTMRRKSPAKPIATVKY